MFDPLQARDLMDMRYLLAAGQVYPACCGK